MTTASREERKMRGWKYVCVCMPAYGSESMCVFVHICFNVDMRLCELLFSQCTTPVGLLLLLLRSKMLSYRFYLCHRGHTVCLIQNIMHNKVLSPKVLCPGIVVEGEWALLQ